MRPGGGLARSPGSSLCSSPWTLLGRRPPPSAACSPLRPLAFARLRLFRKSLGAAFFELLYGVLYVFGFLYSSQIEECGRFHRPQIWPPRSGSLIAYLGGRFKSTANPKTRTGFFASTNFFVAVATNPIRFDFARAVEFASLIYFFHREINFGRLRLRVAWPTLLLSLRLLLRLGFCSAVASPGLSASFGRRVLLPGVYLQISPILFLTKLLASVNCSLNIPVLIRCECYL